MENTRNYEPTLLQSLIAEELMKIKVIDYPAGTQDASATGSKERRFDGIERYNLKEELRFEYFR